MSDMIPKGKSIYKAVDELDFSIKPEFKIKTG